MTAEPTRDDLIRLGREWLAGAPPAGTIQTDILGLSGPVGFVCMMCCRRINRRGCDLPRLASVPVWGEGRYGFETPACALCG